MAVDKTGPLLQRRVSISVNKTQRKSLLANKPEPALTAGAGMDFFSCSLAFKGQWAHSWKFCECEKVDT